MIVAVSADNNEVAEHFGKCEQYILFKIKENKIVTKKNVDAPEHEPFVIPKFLKEKGADFVITGGIGPKAIDLFEKLGVKTISGASGKVDEVIELFLQGKLDGSSNSCNHEN